MKVLHLNENYEIKGGTEIYIHQLQKLLPSYNVDSFFIGIFKNRNKNKYDLSFLTNFKKSISGNDTFDLLKNFVSENRIDLIHVHGISDSKLIRLCLELSPVIRSMHEPRVFCPGNQKFWIKTETICTKPFGNHCFYHAFTQGCMSIRPNKLVKNYLNVKFEIEEAARRYKYILAMSDYMKSEAVKAGIAADKIIVNPYFTPIIERSDDNIAALDKMKHIVFVGRLHVSKGPHLLIKAMKNILIDEDNVVLDIIGDGDYKNKLLEIIKQDNIPAEKIVFHGWLEHSGIIEKIKKSYLVVFPSIYPEAFGIVGIEAMMCCKPVIAFNVGGVPTWLKDGVNGYLVKNKDIDSLTKKIKFLLTNKDVYSEFSKQSRELALKNFIPDIHMKKLVMLYKSAIQQSEE